MYSLSKYMPGLGTEFFINPAHISSTGGAEKYIPSLGEEVAVSMSCINDIGGAEKYIPGLGKQFFINPSHVNELIEPSASPSSTVLSNTDVTVTVTYPVGALEKQYKLGELGVYQAYTVPVVVSSNTTLYARYKNSLGVVSEEGQVIITNIDKVAPVIELTPDTTESASSVTISVLATDASGIESLKYLSDSKVVADFASAGTVITDNSFDVTVNGDYTVYAKDKAGNESVSVITISNIA